MPELFACDVLGVDSKHHRDLWTGGGTAVVDAIGALRAKVGRIVYFDTTDSTGYLAAALLPYVDRYYKAQLLRDRSEYLRPLYGHRLFTDWYHAHAGVADAEPEWSTPVEDPALLERLRVSWNVGTASWSPSAPRLAELDRRLPTSLFVRPPRRFHDPRASRPNDVSCRMNLSYRRQTVAYQREQVVRLLDAHVATDRLGRRAYFSEMRRSKVVISPFGWGEINLKDFETFLAGAALVKPDMAHLVTWPDVYRPDETIVTHRWDLTDVVEVIDELLGDDDRRNAIAAAGQGAYRDASTAPVAAERFASHLDALLADAGA